MTSAAPQIRNQSYELVAVEALTPHPDNPNQGDVGAIVGSMEANGIYGALVVQAPRGNRKRGRILAGNHRWLAAKAAGVSEVPVVWVDVDDERATRIMLADNQTANLASYDDGALAALLVELAATDEGLAGTAFDADDLDDLLSRLEDAPGGPQPGDDDLPDRPAAKTVPGDVWILGPHRLLCGDSTTLDALPKCDALISDPPYGMGLDTSWYGSSEVGSKFAEMGAIDWDASPFDPSLFAEAAPAVALFGANYFCTSLPEPGTWWVWDKRTTSDGGEIDFGGGMPFELIWLRGDKAHRIIRYLWAGYYRQAGTPADERHNQHPTQKPVAVMAELIRYLTDPGDTVLDPFGGSGSTLIAAHQTGRIASLVELDPRYCDVICARFQKITGTLPVAESTGREHDFSEVTDATDGPTAEADGT